MTGTIGLVGEMLGSLRDQAADLDKKTLAMKNLVNITSIKAGSETLIKRGGAPRSHQVCNGTSNGTWSKVLITLL